jgi:hypothetical protein
VHQHDSDHHIHHNHQRRRPGEQADDDQQRRDDLADIDQIAQLGRQAGLGQHAGDEADARLQLGDAMQQGQQAQGQAQHQQSEIGGRRACCEGSVSAHRRSLTWVAITQTKASRSGSAQLAHATKHKSSSSPSYGQRTSIR